MGGFNLANALAVRVHSLPLWLAVCASRTGRFSMPGQNIFGSPFHHGDVICLAFSSPVAVYLRWSGWWSSSAVEAAVKTRSG